jgi:hypothetical protein
MIGTIFYYGICWEGTLKGSATVFIFMAAQIKQYRGFPFEFEFEFESEFEFVSSSTLRGK